jgi:RNA polymerase sigma factor (TIGR02999 family)
LALEKSVTQLLEEFAGGNKQAMNGLVAALYPELRRLARGYLRGERSGHTLQATALVHEAYARLIRQEHPDYRNRAHFMGVAAHVMRQVLIDHARIRNASKRGRDAVHAPLEEALAEAAERPLGILAVDDALSELQRKDSLKARLVEMRFFGGMTAEESAEALDMPVEKVRQHLRVAQAWLRQRLHQA